MATKINRALLSKPHRQMLDRSKSGEPPKWMRQLVLKRLQERRRLSEPGANFRVGQKKIHLPNFTVAMIRVPHLPPTHAQFRVPLHFNKLDLRDYLFHAYQVRVHSVRSFVTGPKVGPRRQNPDPRKLIKGIWHRGERPLSTRLKRQVRRLKHQAGLPWDEKRVRKMMIVHLEKPFVWPPVPKPEDLDVMAPMMMRTMDAAQKIQDGIKRDSGRDLEGEAETEQLLAKQAEALLRGKLAWRGGEGLTAKSVNGVVPGLGSKYLQTTGGQKPVVRTEVLGDKGRWVSEVEYDASPTKDGKKGRKKPKNRTILPLR